MINASYYILLSNYVLRIDQVKIQNIDISIQIYYKWDLDKTRLLPHYEMTLCSIKYWFCFWVVYSFGVDAEPNLLCVLHAINVSVFVLIFTIYKCYCFSAFDGSWEWLTCLGGFFPWVCWVLSSDCVFNKVCFKWIIDCFFSCFIQSCPSEIKRCSLFC